MQSVDICLNLKKSKEIRLADLRTFIQEVILCADQSIFDVV
jgi:hypothetical protein